MSLLDTASLIVTPNGYKEGKLYSVIPSDGSGDMSVTRATTATRVNSAGLVELVPYNLFTYSEQFDNAGWILLNSATITANSTTAPNGTLTADTLNLAASANSCIFQSQTLITGSYTISIYAKTASGTKKFRLRADAPSAIASSDFTATTEWQRFEFTFTSAGGSGCYVINETAGTAGSIYIWGAQLVEGSTAKDYQKTETRLNIPRLDYSNGTCPSLLVEPQRTNRLTYSENQGPSGTNWWPTATWSVVNNSVISPSGIQNADTLVEATSNGYHAGYFNSTIANGFTGTYTISAYAKYNGRFFVLSPKGDAQRTYFNLQNGTIAQLGSGVTASIEDAGNGWYRCIVTCSFSSENVNFEYLLASAVGTLIYTGDGTSGVYIWGCQAEEGSYSTSYIPTTSASVTRNAESLSSPSIPSLFGSTEGSFFIELTFDGLNANGAIPLFLRSSVSAQFNHATYLQFGSSNITLSVYNGGTQQLAISGGTFTNGQNLKVGFAYKANDFVLYVNGIQIGTFTSSSSISTSLSFIDLGSYLFLQSTFQYNGFIKAAALWPTRLTNTQLQQLSTI